MGLRDSGISVTLPALNEVQNIEPLTEEIIDYFEGKKIPYEIIIVNDGSTDGTGRCADILASHNRNVSVIHHPHPKGYGKSLRDGFEASKYDYLFFTDADRQFKIDSLDAFLPYLEEGKMDMVIGYRIGRCDSILRKVFAWGFNSLVRLLFSLRYKDVDCAFKVFKKEAFERLAIKSDDFLFNAELLAKASLKKFSIVQIGVKHHPRAQGESTVSCKHIFLTLERLFSLYKEIKAFRKVS